MTDQKSKWHETRKARMDELFAGRQYTIVEETSFDTPQTTPLGYKVKSGFIIESTDGEQRFTVGKSLINALADEYNAIEKPAPKRRGRPRKEPVDQTQPIDRAETWADRGMPGDASPVTQPGPAMTNPNANEHFEG